MRTNIDIDEKLIKDTLKVTGFKTKREVVDFALREVLRLNKQAGLRKLRGKFHWEGNLEKMRLDK